MIFLTRDIYQMEDGIARMELVANQFLSRFLIYNYAIVVHVILYAGMSFLKSRKFIGGLQHSERLYIIGISAIYVISGITLGLYVEYANSWRDFSPYYLMVSVCFLIIGFLLYTNPKFLSDLSKKYLSSNLNRDEMQSIVSKMDHLFEDEKIYLLRNLTLSQVAEKLDIPSYKISQTLSTLSASNFNDYVNKHRVKYAKGLLKSPDFQHFKIEAIAIDSGFNNKVTFYKAFAGVYQMTPSAFRKRHS
ncbi:helix-turn-helix domain-containing protein [Ekhidna sp.]|uniref:helix-turn-helix domain-containing protein n=1 Tax=Ekhidna sp. TaxID=2608089 RepID=UPI0032EF07BA